jgi:hypothetical protein
VTDYGNRTIAGAATLLGIALVLAQDVVPAWAGFHTWQYSATVALAVVTVAAYALGARRGADGPLGIRLGSAAAGAIVIMAAGIASGLLGPDTETVTRAPGTVAPLPDVGAAGFFPAADAAAIARGDATIVIRRRDGSAVEVGPGVRRFFGTVALETAPQPAAYVEARDARGDRVTITQPTNVAFLSPVLLFGERVTIAGRVLPSDTFATPALHRQIKAFYFSKESATVAQSHGLGGREAVLLAVDDDAGRLQPGGIGFVPSGGEATIGGVRFRVSVGTYPALVISAVPDPLALFLGGILLAGGLAFAFGRRSPQATQRAPERVAPELT